MAPPCRTTRSSLSEEGKLVSGGNFHAEPVAFAADQNRARHPPEVGAIAQSAAVALMVDPTLSFDLAAVPDAEPRVLNPGLMIAEVTTAAADEREKHHRQSRLDGFDTDLRQPGRTTSRWPPMARGG